MFRIKRGICSEKYCIHDSFIIRSIKHIVAGEHVCVADVALTKVIYHQCLSTKKQKLYVEQSIH